ncbi:MAG: hypothetical protein ABIH89_06255 [Elusimicrobiota bacterium]
MEIYQFVKPLGILTYLMVAVTILSGLFKWKLKRHKLLAILTMAIATAHALIVIFFY